MCRTWCDNIGVLFSVCKRAGSGKLLIHKYNAGWTIKRSEGRHIIEQKISMLDKKIDDLVYKLYGLTEEEIRIVEGV